MTFPTIPTVAAGRVLSTLNTNPAGTHTSPNLGSLTKNAGDLLIAIVIIYDGNSTNAEFSSWGGGFTEFADQAGTATMGIGCAYKFSTGSETGTFTVTSADTSANDSAFFLLSIAGAHDSTPPEAGTMATGTGAAADPGSFNPGGWDAEDTLWIAVAGSGEVSTTGSFTGVASAPANYGSYADTGISADVVGGVEGAVAFRQLNASSEDVGTFSVDTSNARNAAIVIAVRPAPAAIVATLSQTLDDVTSASSTALSIAAALSQALEETSLSSAAALSIAAALSQTLEEVSLSSTVQLAGDEIAATLNQTLDDVTLASTATIGIIAALAQTLEDVTLSSTAALEIDATLAQALEDLTLASTAALDIAATLNQTLEEVVLSGTVDLQTDDRQLTLNQTLDDITSSSTAEIGLVATVNRTLDDISASSTATVDIAAQVNQTLDDVSSSGEIDVDVRATLSQTLGDVTLSANANTGAPRTLTLNQTLGDVELDASVDIVTDADLGIGAGFGIAPIPARLLKSSKLRISGGGSVVLEGRSEIPPNEEEENDELWRLFMAAETLTEVGKR